MRQYNDQMIRSFVFLLALAGAVAVGATQSPASIDPPLLERARALHRQVPLIDGHNDFPWALREKSPGRDLNVLDLRVSQPSIMTDIPRLRAGGVGGQFWSVYVPAYVSGPESRHRNPRADRCRPSDGRTLSRYLCARADRGRCRAGVQERTHRVADRDGGRPLDRFVGGDATHDVRARRPLHDADPQPQHPMGRRRDGYARVWRPHRLSAKRSSTR